MSLVQVRLVQLVVKPVVSQAVLQKQPVRRPVIPAVKINAMSPVRLPVPQTVIPSVGLHVLRSVGLSV